MEMSCEQKYVRFEIVLHDVRKLPFGIPNYGFPMISYDYNL